MRPAAVLLAAAALLALTACSAEDDAKPAAPKASAPTVDHSAAEKAAGIPPAPTGDARDAYLDAIAAVDPQIIVDEEKAIDAGRNQCASITSPKADWAAAQRFGNDARPLTDAQGKALNEALRKTLCPK
ncbi:hypothetical protein OG520_22200 [Streptomyces sp. NBC_00984]|uniref:hypothetical protein n=1 Tax=Streptomyces sp. NBC_00984 TaxID=2903700 RepID=UPI0038631C25|nr:hypothetical protein OG520_22200 [Streptomyces sp. NBC_00984]